MLPSCSPVRRAISALGSPCRLRIRISRWAGEHSSSIRFHSSCSWAISLGRGWSAWGRSSARGLVQRPLLLDGAMMLPAAVDQPIAGHLHEERAEVGAVGEPPARLAEAAQDIGPDRLDDVHRVELGPQRARSTGGGRPSAGKARTRGRPAPRPRCRRRSAARSARPGVRRSCAVSRTSSPATRGIPG